MKNRMNVLLIPAFLLFSMMGFAQEYGTASYYSDAFDGMETAYGVKYNKNELTAAHKRHPFGTQLKVTRIDNNKSVIVKVIDKGPWIKGRIVDLSKKAAAELNLIDDEVAEVKVEVVNSQSSNAVAKSSTPKTTTPASTPKPAAETKTTTPKTASTTPKTTRPSEYLDAGQAQKVLTQQAQDDELTAKGGESTAESAAENKKLALSPPKQVFTYSGEGLFKISLAQYEKKGYGVQVATLTSYNNVMKMVAQLQSKWFDDIMVNAIKTNAGKPLYKVILGGPFPTLQAANNYKNSLRRNHNINGFVVDLSKK